MSTSTSSFEHYVANRAAWLVRLSFLLCGDTHLAEDLAQSTLMQLHRRWQRISHLEHPDAYVRRTLLHEYLRWRRRQRLSETPTGTAQRLGERSLDTPDIAEGIAARDATWRLLATLPRRQRAVLVLRYYEDLSDNQIAEALDCAPSTVRSQAARALTTLRGRLSHTALNGVTDERP